MNIEKAKILAEQNGWQVSTDEDMITLTREGFAGCIRASTFGMAFFFMDQHDERSYVGAMLIEGDEDFTALLEVAHAIITDEITPEMGQRPGVAKLVQAAIDYKYPAVSRVAANVLARIEKLDQEGQ